MERFASRPVSNFVDWALNIPIHPPINPSIYPSIHPSIQPSDIVTNTDCGVSVSVTRLVYRQNGGKVIPRSGTLIFNLTQNLIRSKRRPNLLTQTNRPSSLILWPHKTAHVHTDYRSLSLTGEVIGQGTEAAMTR